MSKAEMYQLIGMAKPGGGCPFTGAKCQDGCWAWRFDGETDRCFAFDDMPENEMPGQYYQRSVQEVWEVTL